MKQGFLRDYFDGVAAKILSGVEVDPNKSNQHEFNGSDPLKRLLGPEDFRRHPAQFIWLGRENKGVSDKAEVSWYDARIRKSHRTPEWRLYFRSNDVMEMASSGDLLIVARRKGGALLLVVVAGQNLTLQNQLEWLFGLGQPSPMFQFETFEESPRELDFVSRFVLEEIGVDIEEPDADRLDALLARFQGRFPTTAVFSAFARDTIDEASPLDDPDATLLAWVDHEEKLFRRLERHVVSDRLEQGFISADGADIDGFIKFSLSVQNTRKARAGYALEHHVEEILRAHQIRYSRGANTENRSKPDFLFPGISEYNDPRFPVALLNMLGVKSTCKERWRQVLSEAERIDHKHLLTLEPGISDNQTDEMKAKNLRLVVPLAIHDTFRNSQRQWMMDVSGFLDYLREKQATGA